MQAIFDFGETRHIQLEVFSIKKDEFTITSASYELKKRKFRRNRSKWKL